ncbi:MAG: (d)CMP kinase [Acidimicrobiales bacterium]
MTRPVIAIDGPAGSGKSTVARAVADELRWSFLDTGAMYRALTLEARHRGIDVHDDDALEQLAAQVELSTLPRVCVNGRDVHDEIRSEWVNVAVSVVAANARVRQHMVERQRAFAESQPLGTVVEGRDIATVVFPHAALKVYLTATLDERARRRDDEDAQSLSRRDASDATRSASPLRQAHDALVLDTTERSVSDIVKEIVEWFQRLT